MGWACRRNAPPGFRAAPRADFAVTAIRRQSLTPSRLRRCALRLHSRGKPCGLSPPRRLGAPRRPPTRLRRIGQTAFAADPRCLACARPDSVVSSALKAGRPRPPGRWPGALSCFASNPLRGFAPVGLPSFPRSARLTPPARLPASGLRASLAVRSACRGPLPCPAVFPDFITLSATVARGLVPSRRAGPCPRLRLRAAPTLRWFP